MKLLWNFIDKNTKLNKTNKQKIFLFLNILLFSIIPLPICLICYYFGFLNIEACFCIIGYNGFIIGFLGGLIIVFNT